MKHAWSIKVQKEKQYTRTLGDMIQRVQTLASNIMMYGIVNELDSYVELKKFIKKNNLGDEFLFVCCFHPILHIKKELWGTK